MTAERDENDTAPDELREPLLSPHSEYAENVDEASRNAAPAPTGSGDGACRRSYCCGGGTFSRLQLTAMVSNLSTSYNVLNISMVLPILRELHPARDEEQTSLLATSLLGGMMLGQVLGGALGDAPRVGSLRALLGVMALQVVASLASGLVAAAPSHRIDASGWALPSFWFLVSGRGDSSVYVRLALWRFFLGIGAGAVYPLAAVVSAQQNQSHSRAISHSLVEPGILEHPNPSSTDYDPRALVRVVLTFSMQGIGFVGVPLLSMVLLYSGADLDLVWRLLLAFGSLPGLGLVILYWPTSCGPPISGTQPSQSPVDSNSEDSAAVYSVTETDPETEVNAETRDPLLSQPERLTLLDAIRSEESLPNKLFGTAGSWFLFDVLFYGNTLFQPIVMEAAFGKPESGNSNQLILLQQTAKESLLLTLIALPGYFVAALTLGATKPRLRQTPRYVMLQGFACMAVLYLCIGIFWERLRRSSPLLILLYGLTFFFANYGPNTTTFVLPSLTYSESCRSTLNGVSAAAGKLGAFVGAALFAPAADAWGDAVVMLICSGLALVAFGVTYQFVRLK